MHKSDLIEKILTSKAGRRMLEYISPIYDDSYVGLNLLQIMGARLDIVSGWLDEYERQIVTKTATWSINLWEDTYGIPHDTTLSLDDRRVKVDTKRWSHGPASPYKMTKLAGDVCGFPTSSYDPQKEHYFGIRITANPQNVNERKIRAVLDRAKPAHMEYDITYQQVVGETMYMGGLVRAAVKQTIRQVD